MEGDILKRTFSILMLLVLCGALVLFAASCNSQPQKDRLSEVIAEKIEETGYTFDSYQGYLSAYEKAVAVYEDEKATALEIDKAIEALNAAKQELVRTADFSQLKLAINASEGIDPTLYTEQTYETFLAALNNAKAVLAKDTSKQSEINSAITSLKNAKAGLVKIPSTSSLQQLLQSHVEATSYTSESYAIYQDAYNNAQNLVQLGGASQSDLMLAENLLKQAIAALVQRGDTTALQGSLAQLEKQYLGIDEKKRGPEERYTVGSYSAFMDVFEKATEAVSSGDISAADAADLLKKLNDSALQLIDMSSLLDRIDLLSGYSSQSHFYTEQSYDALVNAVSAGITVVKNASSTADQIKKASDAIDDAITALVRRAVTADGLKDKLLLDKVVTVGNSTTTLFEYFNDYASFFSAVESENVNYAYSFVGENCVEFAYEQVRIMMGEGYLKFSYIGGYPIANENLSVIEFAGIDFDSTEFDVSSETEFGAPTEYTKRTEIIFGVENTIAILSYENEDAGVKVVFEYNTIGNYISSMEFIKTVDQTQPA